MKRRKFLQNSAITALSYAGLSSVPMVISEQAMAAASGKTFIKIFLRGGMDGLSLLVPRSAAQYNLYAAARPNLKIPKNQLLGLKGNTGFGLHPEAVRIRGLFNNSFAILAHGAGSLNNTRSHFTQMDIIEGGKSDVIADNGYIYRALSSTASGLDMVSVGGGVVKSMRGIGSKAVSMTKPESFSELRGAWQTVTPNISKACQLVVMAPAAITRVPAKTCVAMPDRRLQILTA